MHGWVRGCVGGRVYRRIRGCGRMYVWVVGGVGGWVHRWIRGCMDGGMDGWMDGSVGGWMDGCMEKSRDRPTDG